MQGKGRIGIFAKLVLVFLAVLLFMFAVKQPTQAAHAASDIGTWLSDAGTNVGAFVGGLFG